MITQEEKDRIIVLRKYWYNRVYIALEFIKGGLQHKELAMLSMKESDAKIKYRQLLCETYDIWQIIKEQTGFIENLVNLYHSVATFDDNALPITSLNRMRRVDDEDYKKFNNEYAQHLTGYDFVIDLDADTFIDAYVQAKKIKDVFDNYHLGYYLVNSSGKGFHFVIPNDFTDDSIKVLDKPAVFGRIAYNLKGIYDCKGIDTTIYDFRRIKKLPYSLNCGDSTIVLPLSDSDFGEKLVQYQQRYLSFHSVFNRIILKNRGLLIRNTELGKEKLQDNFKKFRRDFA